MRQHIKNKQFAGIDSSFVLVESDTEYAVTNTQFPPGVLVWQTIKIDVGSVKCASSSLVKNLRQR